MVSKYQTTVKLSKTSQPKGHKILLLFFPLWPLWCVLMYGDINDLLYAMDNFFTALMWCFWDISVCTLMCILGFWSIGTCSSCVSHVRLFVRFLSAFSCCSFKQTFHFPLFWQLLILVSLIFPCCVSLSQILFLPLKPQHTHTHTIA